MGLIEKHEEKIDIDALEKKVRDHMIDRWAPGVACNECTSMITPTFVQGRVIFRPFGRPHNHLKGEA